MTVVGGPFPGPAQLAPCPICGHFHNMTQVEEYRQDRTRYSTCVEPDPVYRVPGCGCLVDGRKFALRVERTVRFTWESRER